MGRKVRETFLFVCTFVLLFFSFSFYLSDDVFPVKQFRPSSSSTETETQTPADTNNIKYPPSLTVRIEDHLFVIQENISSSISAPIIQSESILFPDWEVLVAISPESRFPSDSLGGVNYICVFQNNATSPAQFSGVIPFSNLTTFKCILPNSVRRFPPYLQPILTKSPEPYRKSVSDSKELYRWRFIAYQSLSTDDDVILFVKGVNNRQGINRSPSYLNCVFIDGVNTPVKTVVISSNQEVFRCVKPNLTNFDHTNNKIKVSLELVGENDQNKVVPSVAYYTQPRKINPSVEKSLLCASTMVYNVAKFLKEWVYYHSKVGVEKFILYDNGSNDNLDEVISKLLEENYDIEKVLWVWPKTQEAGFSHSAMYAKDLCTWMMYVDVDEFIFSPSWLNAPYPSNVMLTSLLPRSSFSNMRSILKKSSLSSHNRHKHYLHHDDNEEVLGQVSVKCLEFGPSNQRSHPIKGVIQGYTCRRKEEQRHKSIVLIDAIDKSLSNVIHHFELKKGYRVKRLSLEQGVVNHYKYQAWSEFKMKFRRRVSAYVVDWRDGLNPGSKDRTPGLGFEPVEPEDWANRFCEVRDSKLQMATKRWFGSSSNSSSGISDYKMAWQD